MGYLVLPGASASDDSPDAPSFVKGIRVGLAGLALAIASTLSVISPVAAGDTTTMLEGNHPDEAAEIAESDAAPSRPLAMRLTMALRNRAELDRVLADQQNPASPEYHHWLTSDEFTNRFGPTDADLAKVSRWLTRKGFAVQPADARRRRPTRQRPKKPRPRPSCHVTTCPGNNVKSSTLGFCSAVGAGFVVSIWEYKNSA